MNSNDKEVYFNQYCKTCEHLSKNDDQEPCDECLTEPVNTDSHRPVRWEEKRK